jgi:hypothetical protein
MLHGQILIHDASFRFMFLYVILISQTWLDLPAEQRLADLQIETCGWLAAGWLCCGGCSSRRTALCGALQ